MKYTFVTAIFALFTSIASAQNTLPEFMGGQEELFKFIAKNTVYPLQAIQKCQQGTVLVRFKITEKGELDSLTIKSQTPASLSNEALRIVQRTDGLWKPAIVEGGAVASYFTVPIRFVLDDDIGDCLTETDYYNQATQYLSKNDYQQALEAATQAIGINPFGKYYYQVRGKAHLGLGNKQGACADFQQSLMFGNPLAQALIDQNCN
jgi:TonB family protein